MPVTLPVARMTHAQQDDVHLNSINQGAINTDDLLDTLPVVSRHIAHNLPDYFLFRADFSARTKHIDTSLCFSRAAGEQPVGGRLTGRRFYLPNIGAPLP